MKSEPRPKSDYKKVLEKAKRKYADAVRGYEYQKELLNNTKNLTHDEFVLLQKRKVIFLAELTILEDVFTSSVLNKKD
jgi:hypothetical protein